MAHPLHERGRDRAPRGIAAAAAARAPAAAAAGLASLPAPRAQAPAPPAARRRGHGRPSARKGQEEDDERVGELHGAAEVEVERRDLADRR